MMSENKFLVYVDQFKGAALPASWEAMGAACLIAEKLGGQVLALVLGAGSDQVVAEAYQYGAAGVFYCDDASLSDYRPEPYASVVSKTARDQNTEFILLPTTTRGREIAAMVSIDLNTGVMPDVIDLEVQDGEILVTRPVYGGKLLAKAVCDSSPQILTTRARAFKKPELDVSRSGVAERVSPVMAESEIASVVTGYAQVNGGVSLSDANVIVSGGRGVSNNPALTPPAGLDEKQAEIWKAQQGFKLVEELASALGGTVGASRAAVDAGYVPYTHQVGQTGKVVSPDLYVACGISGAIQHLAGMRTSKVIVAINKDADAPIFKLARFGVVGDLYAILPPLIDALLKRLGK